MTQDKIKVQCAGNALLWEIPDQITPNTLIIVDSNNCDALVIANLNRIGIANDNNYRINNQDEYKVNDWVNKGGILSGKKERYGDCKIVGISKRVVDISCGFQLQYNPHDTQLKATLKGNIIVKVKINNSDKFYDNQCITLNNNSTMHLTTVELNDRLRGELENIVKPLIIRRQNNTLIQDLDNNQASENKVKEAVKTIFNKYGLVVDSVSILINDRGATQSTKKAVKNKKQSN